MNKQYIVSYDEWKSDAKRGLKKIAAWNCFFLFTMFKGGMSVIYKAASAIWGKVKSHKFTIACVGLGFETAVLGFGYAGMKTKVMNAEWERDTAEMKLDSLMELDGRKQGYSRLCSYDPEKDNIIKYNK